MKHEHHASAVEQARRAVGERSAIGSQSSAREANRTTEHTERKRTRKSSYPFNAALSGIQNSTQRRKDARAQRRKGQSILDLFASLRLGVFALKNNPWEVDRIPLTISQSKRLPLLFYSVCSVVQPLLES